MLGALLRLVLAACVAVMPPTLLEDRSAQAATTGVWVPTGSMHVARDHATTTVLRDGRVLVAGGVDNGTDLDAAESYDPSTGMWASTGRMRAARYAAAAALLQDGRVLVTARRSRRQGLTGTRTSPWPVPTSNGSGKGSTKGVTPAASASDGATGRRSLPMLEEEPTDAPRGPCRPSPRRRRADASRPSCRSSHSEGST